jgi:O-antigen ligase
MLLRLILAIPIVLMPNLLYVGIDTGIPGVNLANLLLLLVLLVLALSHRQAGPAPGVGELTAPLLLLFVALLIGLLIAQVTTPENLFDDLTYLKNIVFYPLLYFVYRRCRQDLAGTRQLIYLTLAVAVVAGIDAAREGLAFDITEFDDTHRAAGPFGDYHSANRAGVFFVMFLPLLVALVLFLRGRKLWRLLAVAASAVLVLAIMLTYSRQSYLIALVGVALLLLRRHLLLAVLIALATVPAIGLLPEGVTERVVATQQVDAGGSARLDVSTASRFEIWTGALQMWRAHPAGVGLNRFPEHIGDYSRYQGYDAHNIYVLLLAECGPLGLAALLWLLWRMLRLAQGVRRSAAETDVEAKALGYGLTIAVISMALGNVYGSPFYEGLVMANFWILCGLVEHYAALKHHALAATAAPAPSLDATIAQAISAHFPLAEKIAPGRYRVAPK